MSSEKANEQETDSDETSGFPINFNLSDSPAVSGSIDLPNYDLVELENGKRVHRPTSGSEGFVEMDFRKFGKDIPREAYATHQIHKHPAVFIPHIPRHIIGTYSTPLNNSGERPLILDPFNGSGTTGLEAKLLGRDYLGIEINPVSKIISDVKVSPIPPTLARRSKVKLINILERDTVEYHPDFDVAFPDGTEKKRWFEDIAINGLTKIRKAVFEFTSDGYEVYPLGLSQEEAAIEDLTISDDELRSRIHKWFTLMIANTVFDVSNADPSVSKAHRSSKMRELIRAGEHPPDPICVFKNHLNKSLSQFIELWNLIYHTNIPGGSNQERLSNWLSDDPISLEDNNRHYANIDIKLDDAREFYYDEYIEKVDLAITSPPYINAMNYFRGTKLRLFWIQDLLSESLDIDQLKRSIVGTNSVRIRELVDELPKTVFGSWNGTTTEYRRTNLPALDKIILDIHTGGLSEAQNRAYITWKFFAVDIMQSLTRSYEHMKPGSHFFFLIGENTIGGNQISSHRYVADVAQNLGKFGDNDGQLSADDGFDVLGFCWDEISNRDLFQGRNHTSGVIEGEYVVVLQKPKR